ncbi:alanine racemase [Pseudoxanthomonas sp.]|uniref:alanine racemase n=1 Tax=Pseudoxanthomonas sp. TaxID=1871049 RepID=UPI0026168CA9|nr:alanine racemase [Pseudoxanthomonas sp.]WDS37752.1 MAG: alanine racemase [Pseudoxanthomonas sp.]
MRPARALIDLGALQDNYLLARRLGGGKAVAIIKADAYGHGAVRCARALEPLADAFGVACIEEAIELREAGITTPILLLEGFLDADELPLVDQHRLWTAVASPWQLQALANFTPSAPLHVWLKLDSGMHRLGLSPDDFARALQQLSNDPKIASVVAMSHLARADELDSDFSERQRVVFEQATQGFTGKTSFNNSPALLGWPGIHSDWVRPGLMLYGANPFPLTAEIPHVLRPVMQLESRLIAVRDLPAGEAVGYGARFTAPVSMRIGVVAMGYADGYPQLAPNGTPVVVDGVATRLVGRVSMDMLTVDITDLPQATVGSKVVLWGHQPLPTPSQIAETCGTSGYALLCGIKRVRREYIDASTGTAS